MRKKIQRASLKERLYFLFHGIIPNYAMRANHDVSNAWINILSKNLKGEGYDFWKYTSEEQKKTVLTFFCTNRISSVYEIRKKFEKEFPRHYKGNEGMSSLGFDFGRPDYLPEDEQDKQEIVEEFKTNKPKRKDSL